MLQLILGMITRLFRGFPLSIHEINGCYIKRVHHHLLRRSSKHLTNYKLVGAHLAFYKQNIPNGTLK